MLRRLWLSWTLTVVLYGHAMPLLDVDVQLKT